MIAHDTPREVTSVPLSARLASVDIFRGIMMLLMLFFNDMNDPDLGHMNNVPWWLNHMAPGIDGMTLPDVIFPAFLFIVGVSIPLAFSRRMGSGHSRSRLCGHVLERSLSLLVIGLLMVNTYTIHATAMPISPGAWELFLFICVVLVWNRYPAPSSSARKRLYSLLRGCGLLGLAFLAIIYRGDWAGTTTWLRTSWWGIPGLIGIAYCIASGVYLGFAGKPAGIVAVIFSLTALNLVEHYKGLGFLHFVSQYLSIGGVIGGLGSIAVSGLFAGMLLGKYPERSEGNKLLMGLFMLSAVLCVSGMLLRPFGGISKHDGTPAWCLVSAGLCCAALAFLHWLVDRRGIERWARPVLPAGTQPLLTFILPHLFYSALSVIGVTFLENHLNTGSTGITRSLVLAVLMVGVTGPLIRLGIVLRI